jgi:hypothetical protein
VPSAFFHLARAASGQAAKHRDESGRIAVAELSSDLLHRLAGIEKRQGRHQNLPTGRKDAPSDQAAWETEEL